MATPEDRIRAVSLAQRLGQIGPRVTQEMMGEEPIVNPFLPGERQTVDFDTGRVIPVDEFNRRQLQEVRNSQKSRGEDYWIAPEDRNQMVPSRDGGMVSREQEYMRGEGELPVPRPEADAQVPVTNAGFRRRTKEEEEAARAWMERQQLAASGRPMRAPAGNGRSPAPTPSRGGADSRYATRQMQIDRLVRAGEDPEKAARVVDADIRRSGPRPMGLFAQDSQPAAMRALRQRIDSGRQPPRRDELPQPSPARSGPEPLDPGQAAFQASDGAAAGAPGYGYDEQGNPVRVADATDAGRGTGFGQTRQDPVLAAREAESQETLAQFADRNAASQKADKDARAAGYKSSQDKAERAVERAAPGLAGRQWVAQQVSRYGISSDEAQSIWAAHSRDNLGRQRTPSETRLAIAASGIMEPHRLAANAKAPPVPRADRDRAVRARADRYNTARDFAGPNGRAYAAASIMGARDDQDLQQVYGAMHAMDPRGGWDAMSAGVGANRATVDAASAKDRDLAPDEKLGQARARIRSKPLAERAQGYRDMHMGITNGQGDIGQSNLFLVQNGAADAAEAAQSIVSGEPLEGAETYLQEWTAAYVASGAGTDRRAYEQWIRRLGLGNRPTQESLALWAKLTGQNVRYFTEWMGLAPVPSARQAQHQEAKPAPRPRAAAKPAPKPAATDTAAAPRKPRRPFDDG